MGDESNVGGYIYTNIFSRCLLKTKRGGLFAWLISDLVNVVPQCPMPAMATSTSFSLVSATHVTPLISSA